MMAHDMTSGMTTALFIAPLGTKKPLTRALLILCFIRVKRALGVARKEVGTSDSGLLILRRLYSLWLLEAAQCSR